MTELMRWRMMGYMIALFVAGAITGAAVMSQTATGSQTLKIGRTQEMTRLIMGKFEPLNLTDEQKAKFTPLIQRASEELEGSHLACLQQCTSIIDKLHAQMNPDLTPEQRAELQRLESARRETMHRKYNFTVAEPRTDGTNSTSH